VERYHRHVAVLKKRQIRQHAALCGNASSAWSHLAMQTTLLVVKINIQEIVGSAEGIGPEVAVSYVTVSVFVLFCMTDRLIDSGLTYLPCKTQQPMNQQLPPFVCRSLQLWCRLGSISHSLFFVPRNFTVETRIRPGACVLAVDECVFPCVHTARFWVSYKNSEQIII